MVCYQTSQLLQSSCMKFSGFMCLGIRNLCGNFCCKQTSTWKVFVLAFICGNLHPVITKREMWSGVHKYFQYCFSQLSACFLKLVWDTHHPKRLEQNHKAWKNNSKLNSVNIGIYLSTLLSCRNITPKINKKPTMRLNTYMQEEEPALWKTLTYHLKTVWPIQPALFTCSVLFNLSYRNTQFDNILITLSHYKLLI